MPARRKLPILHLKIMGPISLALALILGATGYYALRVEEDFLRQQTLQRARSLLGALEVLTLQALAMDEDTRLRTYLSRLRAEEKDIHAVSIFDRFGTPRLHFTRQTLPPSAFRRTFIRNLTLNGLARGRIELTVAPAAAAESIQRMTLLIVLALLDCFLFFGLLLHLALKYWISEPLTRFLDFAHRIADGDLEQRVDIRSRDEIGELAAAFDSMAESLARSRDEIRNINLELEGRVHQRTSEVLAILESLSDGLLVTDDADRIVRMNPAAAQILGCDAGSCLGRPAAEFLQVSNGDAAADHEGLAEGETFLRKADGSRIPCLISRAPVRTPSAAHGAVITFRDISRLRDLHLQVRRSDRLSSVGLLAAGVAHELNNPLANISTFTQLLQEKGAGAPDFLASSLEKIQHEVTRASRIVRNLLEFARQAPPSIQPVALSELVESTLRIVAPSTDKAGIRIVTDVPAALPVIRVDGSRLQQVLINLLTNAIHAVGRGGEIRVSADPDPVERDDRPFLAIRVRDTGPGIPEDQQALIFDPFYTTKDVGEGTGLGLSVSYGIVRDHGGSIEIESESGHGSTFTVLLPWQGADEEETEG